MIAQKGPQFCGHDVDVICRSTEILEVVGPEVGWNGFLIQVTAKTDLSQKVVIAGGQIDQRVPCTGEGCVCTASDVSTKHAACSSAC